MSLQPPLLPTAGVEIVTDRRAVLLGGGLVLGLFVAGKSRAQSSRARVNPAGPQPLSTEDVSAVAGAAFNGFAPDAFIRITRDNQVILIIPNVEMGQGVYMGESSLIAEELEVGLDQVLLAPAPPDEKLYKQPILQFQGTGGSTSIRGAYQPLRMAGAAARTLLITAAANRWQVPAAECVAERATVRHALSGRQATYGELVDDASRLPKPQQVALKDPSQFRIIGKMIRRIDTPAKVNGTAVYGIDVMRPGMKFATARTCPWRGGTLAGVDDSAALAIPGVVQVVRLPNAVAVVGDHFWAAKQGLDALEVQWNRGPNAQMSSEQLWASLDQASRAGQGAVAVSAGNFDQAFRGAAKTVEAVYRQPFLCHAPMEPQAAVVEVKGGRVDVWCGTQVPTSAQAAAAKVAGVPPEAVSIHNHLIGGAFGRKLETDYVEQAVAIAKACPFPVKMVWTREQDTQHDNYRPMYVDRLAAGLDANGRPVAWKHRVAAASVTLRFVGPAGMRPNGVDPDAVEEAEDPVYGKFPNMHVDYVRWTPPEGLTVSWWRGVGPTHTIFVVESFVDELAHAAGKDPVAYRRDLLRDQPRALAVLNRVAEASGWGSPLPAGCGRGVIVQKSFGSFMAVVVEVAVTDEGDVLLRRITAAVDSGVTINPSVLKQQVEGGVLFGLSAALHNEITFKDGVVQQSNFNDYRQLRINETPPVEVIHLPTSNPPGGIGEAGTTAAAPALCNAIFAATGVRLREIPVRRQLIAKAARKRHAATLIPPLAAAAALRAPSTASRSPSPADAAEDLAPPRSSPARGGGGSPPGETEGARSPDEASP